MDNIISGIHQPNFMPWLGYFYKIYQSDIFIFLDDVQFPKTGSSTYVNRVSINISGESRYITVPIKRASGTWAINETQFSDEKWKKKAISTLQGNYAKAKYFKEHRDLIFELIEFQADDIATYNINFIKTISKELGLKSRFVNSSEFEIKSSSTQRLIDLLKAVGATTYLSGSGGDNYQDHQMYKDANIKVIYNKMPPFEYPQVKSESFVGGLSIVDAIFNIGIDSLKKELFI